MTFKISRYYSTLYIRCSIIGCSSLKDETFVVFKSLVINEKFQLQVMDVDLKQKILKVDLLMNVEDNVKFTSVRDVLIFCGRAVFETNPYSALPNINCHAFDYFQPLTEGSRHTRCSSATFPFSGVAPIVRQDGECLQCPEQRGNVEPDRSRHTGSGLCRGGSGEDGIVELWWKVSRRDSSWSSKWNKTLDLFFSHKSTFLS